MAVSVIYETHATTADNEAGIATGWLPGALSALGRVQALELGERRRAERIDAVFSSDLWRALETARLAFGARGVPIIQDARLRECNYGALNGQPVARLALVRRQHVETPFPDGQSYREVIDATRAFLRDLARDWNGSRVLVIAHSANRWALECLLGAGVIEELVDAPFAWQKGWSYTLPDSWDGAT
jgi:alpha-ribazole phosphatase/probable phosphoglycerate mutase